MQYTTSFGGFLAATLATAGMVSAFPTIPPRVPVPVDAIAAASGSASLKQVRNNQYNGKSKHGTIALEKAYLKFNVMIPEDVSSAVSRIRSELLADLGHLADLAGIGRSKYKRSNGSAITTPQEYDVEYLTPVQIGTPAQTLMLDFDTGSSDLWVYSSATPSSDVKGQTVYDPDQSETSMQLPNATWSISYGDGSSSKGQVYYDNVTIGGLSVYPMAVEAASDVSAEFTSDTDIDGLLGLAFSKLNTVKPKKQKTFFEAAQNKLDSYLFTADLKAGAPGTYNFGFIDDTAYTGNISYTDIDTSGGFWKFSTTGYQIGDGDYESVPIHGIADTGTTLMLLPTNVAVSYYQSVHNSSYDQTQGGFVFPCDAELPDFSFGVGGEDGNTTVVVPGSYINYSPTDKTNATCYGGIQGDSSIGFAIFGDIALKAAFVVFDGEKEQIGFATKNL
ncbi:hypothetical protein SLS53_003018 [Cytospora paraplurivora]|uniref:Peptidase A1 domain-containing protein n=1 Tax=Cytospora paraplurivora TaxID=2898453 RepID=A0AAN9YHW4_9PEZI